MKRIIALALTALLCLTLLTPIVSIATTIPNLVVDKEDILSDEDRLELEVYLSNLVATYNMDIAVVLINSLDGKSAQDYADDYYDYNEYGIGAARDGLLIVLSIGDRQWHISTCGAAISVFSDRRIEQIGNEITPFLKNSDYAGACMQFAMECDFYLAFDQDYDSGGSTKTTDPDYYDDYYPPSNTSFPPWSYIGIALGAALVIALIIVFIMKSQLKSVRRQELAHAYIRNGSFNVTRSQDLFLYRTVSSRLRPQDDSHHGGGSSTHSSSSGSSHGGGGGRW